MDMVEFKGSFFFLRSYHDGEHYNSLRLKEDACGGPARPVVIEVFFTFKL